MKFFVDECCNKGLVASLRENGHDVLYATEEKTGATDDEILLNAYNGAKSRNHSILQILSYCKKKSA